MGLAGSLLRRLIIPLGLTMAVVASTPQGALADSGRLALSVSDGDVVSKTTTLTAASADPSDTLTLRVDGAAVPAALTESPPATLSLDGSGIQTTQGFKNSVVVNGTFLPFPNVDVSGFQTLAISIPPGILHPGDNAVTVRAASQISPTDLTANHDGFSFRNLRIQLQTGTTLTDPSVPATHVFSLGDGFPGGNATESGVTANLTVPATSDQLRGLLYDWDTTTVSDGPHTVSVDANGPSGPASTEATVQVDNTGPTVAITSPAAGGNYVGGQLDVTATATDAISGVAGYTAKLDGVAIPVPDSFPTDNIAPGSHSLVVTARDGAGNTTSASETFTTAVAPIPADRYYKGQLYGGPVSGPEPPTLAAAGDIACAPGQAATPITCQQVGTAAIVNEFDPTAVAALADQQYDVGTLANFLGSYDHSWGSFKAKTHPAAGNHEYGQANYPGARADGYFDYFDGVGQQTGPVGDRERGYYSYDLGAWHIVVLNSECGVVSCVAGSGEQTWLKADLRAHRARCTLAYWHEPLFTAGTTPGGGNNLASRDLWRTPYANGADVILNGHDHNYQRFAPQTPDGVLDTKRGIREFVVGTGGDSHFPLPNAVANLQAFDDTTFGVLRMTLEPDS